MSQLKFTEGTMTQVLREEIIRLKAENQLLRYTLQEIVAWYGCKSMAAKIAMAVPKESQEDDA